MFSFIRKRLPSKDRNNNEQLPYGKSNQEEKEIKDNQFNEKKKKKKKKEKESCSSTVVEELVFNRNVSPLIQRNNQSYSQIDYFPMMSSSSSQSFDHQKTKSNQDFCDDSYFNPSEVVDSQRTNLRKFDIPVLDCRNDRSLNSSNDLDHQRTKVPNELTEERIRKKV